MKSWRKDPGTVYEITGVVKKINSPTSITFNAVYNSGELNKIPSDPQETYPANIYVRLNAPRPDSILEEQVNRIYKASFAGLLEQRHTSLDEYIKSGKQYGIRLMPLQKVHLYPLNSESVLNKLMPVLALSILLLLIAIINFANLSTAQVIGRAKEAGVRKVIGANKKNLIFQFFFQAAIQCFLALIIALFLVELFLPFFNQIFDTSLSIWFYHHAIALIWWQLIVIIFITILLS
jgi:putative ABC transport system permease protein